MTTTEAINRGYNLMVSTFLLSAGLAFGTVGFNETDTPDKIDDFGLLIVGLVAVVWYAAGRSRTRRSFVGPVLVLAALGFQVFGALIERDDPTAFGDNIGGMLLLVTFSIVGLWQWLKGPTGAS
jgi:hypothetical protein